MKLTLKNNRNAQPTPVHTSAMAAMLRGVRYAMIVVLIAAAWSVGRSFAVMFRGETSKPASVEESNSIEQTPVAPLLPMAGQWSFADLDWDLKSHVADRKVIDTRFITLADAPAPGNIEQLPELSNELTELAAMLRIRPVDRAGNQVYRLHRADIEAQLVVRNSKAVSLVAAFPQVDGTWKLLELSPRRTSGKPSNVHPHLLPLPPNATRNGGRYSNDGSLLLELVTLDSNAEELISSWKAAGWEVRPSGMGGPNEFSMLCARDGEVIYAWSAKDSSSLQNLMLVRSSNDAAINP
jgi:hypothetical protein